MKLFHYIMTLSVVILTLTTYSFADTAKEMDLDANKALKKFYREPLKILFPLNIPSI